MSRLDHEQERRRLEAAQKVLNIAWLSGGLGTAGTLLGIAFHIPPRLIGPWLILCAIVCAIAMVGFVITFFRRFL